METWNLRVEPAPGCAVRLHLALAAAGEVPADDDWLGPRERAALARLRFEKRRSDWRLGRWIGKQALVQWLTREPPGTAPPDLPALEVLAAADGAPEARGRGSLLPLAFSLSHRCDWGLAAVADHGLLLGCDLERIEPRSDAFVRDYFTAGEGRAVAVEEPSLRPLLANLLWSAKESALKAQRAGLRLDPREVQVDEPHTLAAQARSGSWNPLSLSTTQGSRFTGAWLCRGRREGDLLLTWVAGTTGSPDR